MLSPTAVRTGTAVLALALALTGCKSSKTTAAPSAAAPVRTAAAPSAAAASPAAAASSAAGAATGTKTCTAGHTAAVIGGVSKCLAPGQECSSKHVNDYPQYGYTCEQNGTRYTLKKKT